MGGRTLFEVLRSKWDCLFNLNVACFPVVLLEDVFVVATRLGLLKGVGRMCSPPIFRKLRNNNYLFYLFKYREKL